jgi:uridine kinase
VTADLAEVAPEVLALARSRPPRLGASRLICVDGPAGSGKTTLAEKLAAESGATVVHLDELLDGWTGGLPKVVEALVNDVLTPLAAGRPAAYRRYDWHAGRFADWVPVPANDLLIVEGVGSGSKAAAAYASAVVWVEAPYDLRKTRGLTRDGDDFAPHWDAWALMESEHFALESTRSRADVRLATG